ncbi:MAG: phosphoenolpyruvate--protein phosphotransferase [Finegoldia sp.]|nr:phosphoenolpyruvate--protein phosphotransferase [Finegoldia sp.]
MEEIIKGVGISKGYAIGKHYHFEKQKIAISEESISEDKVAEGINFCKNTIDSYIEELELVESSSGEAKAISEAHIQMLSDPYFFSCIEGKIREDLKNAELAIYETCKEMAEVMASLDDLYLKEREADYRDIGESLVYKLRGLEKKSLSALPDKVIVACQDLSPTDALKIDNTKVLGFVTEKGSKTSHTAIIAQNLSIPAVSGIENLSESLKTCQSLIVNGYEGIIIIDPDEDTLEAYRKKIEDEREKKHRLESIKGKKAVTKDGKEIRVGANIGNLEDLSDALKNACDGVGLFRTEMLYMKSQALPSEEDQFAYYKKAGQLLDGKELIIRTLDIGGDKGVDYLQIPKEDNPFLGYRAIRLCLDRPDIFKAQLRAILRASALGNIKIMLPYLISLEEIRQVKKFLEEIKSDLDREKIAYDKDIEVGIMVETPAAVIMADKFAEEVDFFSIGTNDLTQYILAADRGNTKIVSIYNPYNPAVLRAIKYVIDQSHKKGKWTGMCGAFASDPDATRLLVGLGLDEFSLSASKISEIKSIIINSSYEEEREFANRVINLSTVAEVEDLVRENNKKACF